MKNPKTVIFKADTYDNLKEIVEMFLMALRGQTKSFMTGCEVTMFISEGSD